MMTLKRVENVEEESICEAIRRKVFIVEQGVDENLELDEHDTFGSSDYYPHYLALVDGVPAGTFRMHRLDDGSLKLQRFCVLSDYRRKGVGRFMLAGLEKICRGSGYGKIVMGAQCTAVPFYEKCGYTVVSGVFMDAGIRHVEMQKIL